MASDTADRWPIEPSRLLADPDPDKIELAAKWHLSRALTIGNVIAFVGSGVPMAYGRITWRALVETLAREVLSDYDRVEKDTICESHIFHNKFKSPYPIISGLCIAF